MAEFFSGYAIEHEDHQFLRESAVSIETYRVRDIELKRFDPRPLSKVHDQGNIGSCRGHSLSEQTEIAFYRATGMWIEFSRMWCYLGAQRKDGLLGRDVGSTIAGGVKLATKDGICREALFPYPDPVRYSTGIPDGAAADAARYKLAEHVDVRSWEEALQWVGSGGTIDIGCPWTEEMANLRGDCDTLNPRSRQLGGHATAMTGMVMVDGLWRLLWKNSHSERWGEKGWSRISQRAFEILRSLPNTEIVGLRAMPITDTTDVDPVLP